MKIQTHLISGAGNTFHITYNNGKVDNALMKQIAIRVCKKSPADGLIFLFNKRNNEYAWDFFNNDGSLAEMCGNATRCVGYYIKNILNSEKSYWQLSTTAGKIKIEFISNESFKITMTPIREFKSSQGFYCNTGVPHLVVERADIKIEEKLKLEAKKIRESREFAPRGTNVTFVSFESEKAKIKAVSYERGVEDFTAACGTGAMAAAYFNLTKRGVKQTQVEMPGGTLMMDLSDLSRPTMTGPAILLGSAEYEVTT